MYQSVAINNLRYADDTVLLADSAEGVQKMVSSVVTTTLSIKGWNLTVKGLTSS